MKPFYRFLNGKLDRKLVKMRVLFAGILLT